MEEKIESPHKKILQAIDALDKKCDRIEKLVKDKPTAPAPNPTTSAANLTTSISSNPAASLPTTNYQQSKPWSSKGKTMFAATNLSLSPEEVEKEYKYFKSVVIEACQGGNKNNSLFEKNMERVFL